MEVTLKDVLNLAKEIPAKYLEETLERLQEIKEKSDSEEKAKGSSCPHCESEKIVRNGKRNGKQAYLCRNCGKTFVETATSAVAYSHSSETVWEQVIRDTVYGVPLDQTAADLDLNHSTVFHMRHKILNRVEQELLSNPVVLQGVCETDEAYILESVKGRKIPEGYHRPARKHGAVAAKRGISNEYICLQTSITGDGKAIAVASNRAMPSKEEIVGVFGDKIAEDTVVLCDGNPNYDALNESCTVAHTKRINKVNGFHSFIKARNRNARGFATIYLNRYSAFFSFIFANADTAVKEIYNLMTSRTHSFSTISCVRFQNLCNV